MQTEIGRVSGCRVSGCHVSGCHVSDAGHETGHESAHRETLLLFPETGTAASSACGAFVALCFLCWSASVSLCRCLGWWATRLCHGHGVQNPMIHEEEVHEEGLIYSGDDHDWSCASQTAISKSRYPRSAIRSTAIRLFFLLVVFWACMHSRDSSPRLWFVSLSLSLSLYIYLSLCVCVVCRCRCGLRVGLRCIERCRCVVCIILVCIWAGVLCWFVLLCVVLCCVVCVVFVIRGPPPPRFTHG